MRLIHFALSAATLVSVVHAQTAHPTTATAPPGYLHLIVLDQASQEPLADAAVNVTTGGPKTKFTTDEDGIVEVPLPASSVPYLQISVTERGYVRKYLLWNFREATASEPLPTSYTLQMEQGRTIGGRVIDDAGKPVAGAHVQLWINKRTPNSHESVSDMRAVRSGTDGSWTYNNAPSESDSIRVGAWDYDHATDGTYPIDLVPSDQLFARKATIILPRGVPVRGTVFGVDGKPLGNVDVSAGGVMGSNRLPPQKTTADGRFTYRAKPNSMFVLTAMVKGCAPELQQVNVADQPCDVQIHLVKSKPMIGIIVDTSGKPVPGAWVYPDTWRGSRSLEVRLQADANGKFTWADAPTDGVLCDIDATQQGFIRRQEVLLQVSDAPLVIKVTKSLHITGTVVDADTGKPIDVFRVVPGMSMGDGQRVYYERERSEMRPRGGKIDYVEEWERPGFVTRIEADGYMPAVSRKFTASEGEVHLEFKLQHAASIEAHVLTADGHPSVGTTVAMVLPGQYFGLMNGAETFNRDTITSVSDNDGKVTFSPQDGDYLLVAYGGNGYVELHSDALSKNANQLKLQPWAHVRGTLMIGNKPAGAGNEMVIWPRNEMQAIRDENAPRVSQQLQASTDNSGHFAFDRVPPGSIDIARQINIPMGNGMSMGSRSQVQIQTVQPDQTLDVTIGGQGRAIFGKVVVPPELAGRSDWMFSPMMTLRIAIPHSAVRQMLRGLFGGGGQQDRTAEQQQYEKYSYPVIIQKDGTFRVDDVAANTYELNVAIQKPNAQFRGSLGQAIASGSASVVVPAMPGGRDDAPLEIPPIVLQLTPPPGARTMLHFPTTSPLSTATTSPTTNP